ncbi:uncharacterized protein A4U43_C01F7420 [Asparagus officinalis]|uniref:PB1 domain-containing protein n=1 Tax=Asparagus officinalis TaxID=4686 RepID=A0A5P1FSA5_ASPOF|nr:uncharacterized protein LOC109835907 [Asparagus officinalis]ONK79540.1 uncharacterized protein A4U43_C01F7420 [Asparagus officinalis]
MENYACSSYTNSDASSPLSSPSIAVSALDDLPPAAARVKLMCSFGGKIQPRSNEIEIKLAYVVGETKILSVDRSIRFPAIIGKLSAISGYDDFILKYQFPGEDLDSLISVTNDGDLDHMMMEYDRLQRIESKRIPWLRLFLFGSIRKKNQDPSPAVTPREAPDYLFGLDAPPEKEVGEPAPELQRVQIGEKQQGETLARACPPVQGKSPPAPVPEPAQACWQNPRLASIVCEDGKFYLVPMSQGVFPANYTTLQRVVPPACNSPTAAYPAAANFGMGAYDNCGAGFAAYDSVGRQVYYTGTAATYQSKC